MSSEAFLRNLWRWKCGLPDEEPKKVISYDELKKSEWSDEFEQLMRNRLMMGALRYGLIKAPGKPRYNRVDSIRKRLFDYQYTGNKELLVDCANLCLLEFVECYHPDQHFNAIDDGEHVQIKNNQ